MDQKDNSGAPPSVMSEPELPKIDAPELETPEILVSSPPIAEPEPPRVAEPSPQKSRGPLLPLLGGAVAAALGFGAAQLVPQGWPIATPDTSATQALEARLLQTEAALKATPDTSDLTNRLKALEGALAQNEELTAQIAQLQSELTALQSRPASLANLPSGSDVSALLAPLQAEIEDLKSGLTAARDTSAFDAEIERLRQSAQAERQATEARAEETVRQARAVADATRADAAALRLRTAIDSGTSLQEALTDLESIGIDVPSSLTGNAAGVRTLAELQVSFPEAARAALAASYKPQENAGISARLTAFFLGQANVRSLHPQEGSSPDAVLSRMEALIKAGDLTAALREADALPETAKDAISVWLNEAHDREEASEAAMALLKTAKEGVQK